MAQQPQRIKDVLQLRSDELSAENEQLRMQNDYPFSQMFSARQNEYMPSHATMAMHQHASPAGVPTRGVFEGSRAVSSGTGIIFTKVGIANIYSHCAKCTA